MEWCQCELCEGVEGGTVGGGWESWVQLGILSKNTVAMNDH